VYSVLRVEVCRSGDHDHVTRHTPSGELGELRASTASSAEKFITTATARNIRTAIRPGLSLWYPTITLPAIDCADSIDRPGTVTMLRAALFRTSGAIAPRSARLLSSHAAVATRRLTAAAASSRVGPSFSVRAVGLVPVRRYGSGPTLNQNEVEGRILSLLKGFDKVRCVSQRPRPECPAWGAVEEGMTYFADACCLAGQ